MNMFKEPLVWTLRCAACVPGCLLPDRNIPRPARQTQVSSHIRPRHESIGRDWPV